LAAWLTKWSGKYSKLTGWVEENIDETLTFYRLPRQHHKHLKSTNMLERLNEEIRRRTQVVRIFPNGESCLRLVRALAVETHASHHAMIFLPTPASQRESAHLQIKSMFVLE
jgi:putative transposase